MGRGVKAVTAAEIEGAVRGMAPLLLLRPH